MPIKKILFPTKFRELAYESLETLFPLKKAGLEEVVLCNVIVREDVGFVPYGGYLKEEANKLREEAKIRFEDWQKSLSERGIGSKVSVSVGETVHEILKTAEEEHVDMIVIGRKKRVDSTKAFVGSFAHKIIIRSKVPVLVSKYMVQFEWEDATLTKINKDPFETPFLAVDFSERCVRCLDILTSLKRVVRKAFLFCNIDEKTLEKSSENEIQTLKASIAKKLDEYGNHLKGEGIESEPHIGAGNVLEEMIRIARERNASMIIVGNTCEDHFLSNILDRSLSYQIANLSELPTLLVP